MNKHWLAFVLVLACVQCKQPAPPPVAPATPVQAPPPRPPYDCCFYRYGYVVQKAGDTATVPIKLAGTDVTLSPDGNYIAFTDESNAGRRISIMDLATFTSSPLDTSSGPSYEAVWSPDGKYIACNAMQGGEWNTKIVDLKTRKAFFFPFEGDAGDTHPEWSADGKKIIAHGAHINVFTLDGRNTRSHELTNLGGSVIDDGTRFLMTAQEDKIVFDCQVYKESEGGGDDSYAPKHLFLFDWEKDTLHSLEPPGYVCNDPILKGDTVFCTGFDTKGSQTPGIYRMDLSGEHFALVIPDAQHFSCRRAFMAR